MKIKIVLLLFLFVSCKQLEPAAGKGLGMDTLDFPDQNWVNVTFLNEDDLWKKKVDSIRFEIAKLKKENHLLRVEIDDLKREQKILKMLLKTKKSITKLKSSLAKDAGKDE